MSEIATPHETCLKDCKQPVVFRHALSSWECSSWTLSDWASKTRNVALKFRIGNKYVAGAPQWETEGSRSIATIEQFSQWISGDTDKRNELATVDRSSHFAYSSYNYMHDVFRDQPDVLEAFFYSSPWTGLRSVSLAAKVLTAHCGSEVKAQTLPVIKTPTATIWSLS